MTPDTPRFIACRIFIYRFQITHKSEVSVALQIALFRYHSMQLLAEENFTTPRWTTTKPNAIRYTEANMELTFKLTSSFVCAIHSKLPIRIDIVNMSQWEMDGVTTVELLIDLNTQKEFRKIDFPSNANIH